MRWENVWIIGASSGIGRELAIQLSDQAKNIVISARSEDKLQDVAHLRPNIKDFPLDVTDREKIAEALETIEETTGPLDLVIYNPGILKLNKTIRHFNAEDCLQSMSTNYMGAIYLLEDLIPRMTDRRKGQIALTGSLAGYRGMKSFSAYGPTKAAIINLAESLKLELDRFNINVSVINPGYVETPLVENGNFQAPFAVSAEKAANIIIKGLQKKKFEIAFPLPAVRIFKRLRSFPNGLFFYLSKRFIKWG